MTYTNICVLINQQGAQFSLHGIEHRFAPQTFHQRTRGLVLTATHGPLQMTPDDRMKVPRRKQQAVQKISASQPRAGRAVSSDNVNREMSTRVDVQSGTEWSPGPSGNMLYRGPEGSDQIAGQTVTDQLYPGLVCQRGMQHLGQTPGQARTFGVQRRFRRGEQSAGHWKPAWRRQKCMPHCAT